MAGPTLQAHAPSDLTRGTGTCAGRRARRVRTHADRVALPAQHRVSRRGSVSCRRRARGLGTAPALVKQAGSSVPRSGPRGRAAALRGLETLRELRREVLAEQLPRQGRQFVGEVLESLAQSQAGGKQSALGCESLPGQPVPAFVDLLCGLAPGSAQPVVLVPQPFVVNDRCLRGGQTGRGQQGPMGVPPPAIRGSRSRRASPTAKGCADAAWRRSHRTARVPASGGGRPRTTVPAPSRPAARRCWAYSGAAPRPRPRPARARTRGTRSHPPAGGRRPGRCRPS